MGKLDFWLRPEIVSHKKVGPPTTWVRPLPINILNTLDSAYQCGSPIQQVFMNLIWIILLFLLHTRKYCSGGTDTTPHPFNLQYAPLFTVPHPLNNPYTPTSDFSHANFTSILFTTQKNGVNSDSIGHGRIINPQSHPVTALYIWLSNIWRNGTTTNTYLDNVQFRGLGCLIKSDKITASICSIIRDSIVDVGFVEACIRTHYLWAGGDMTLLLYQF